MATTRKQRTTKRSKVLKEKGDRYSILAGDSSRARLMSTVEPYVVVPTIFTSLNRALTVGGAPLSCVWTLHGPSGDGKTALLIALMRSFQLAGGLSTFVDAEMAADTRRWFGQLGLDREDVLYIGRTGKDEDHPPFTYEEVTEECDRVMKRFVDARKDGSIDRDTPLILGVDSISKMVPAGLFKALEKEGGKAIRSGLGRLQALMNTTWLAELGPKVGDELIAFVIIAHEMEAGGGVKWAPDYKVRGGKSLRYDSMVQIRVTFAGQVRDLKSEGSPVVGKRHRIRVLKNKHGPPYQEATFYTSTGEGLAPAGFDFVREIVHEGLLRGTIKGPKDPREMTIGTRLEWKGTKVMLKQLYAEKHADMVGEMRNQLDAREEG